MMKNSLRLLTLAVALQFAYPVYAATKNYTAARDAIVRHIDDLVSALAARAAAP